MKKTTLVFLAIAFLFYNCTDTPKTEKTTTTDKTSKNSIGLVIHGGAGTILKKNMTPEREAEYKAMLEKAAKKGYEILNNGGSSLDAVEQTIHILENSPLFNAGKGAVFANNGKNELDASIMEGKTLNAGAVAGVTNLKNPISAARKVMENSDHVLLARKGAEEFAAAQGLEVVDTSYFYTEARYNSLQRAKEGDKDKAAYIDPYIKDYKYGTVGCVALDKDGNIAAGTSTGGMTNKKWNRVGDSPIIGAGTYANNKTCAVSATGHGEYFIRAAVAHDISAMMEYKNMSLQDAAKEVIQNKLKNMGGDGGIIAIDVKGNLVAEFNTPGMYRAMVDEKGTITIGIYKDE
ncbi:beta-aspartyl-peptidase (threonine type) [Kordia periserrulae]|uniref:Isoaspartyl peptidase n=1 Tax=Kordia periserrulae TaxID=701523 RepID=A0A2T6BX19_9FLAO|nr:isoaspartyl peptidase/L-asparaginase [Kordia periserrulae]PTX60618.1 beta-aspartyl-peptidase (threonine type) [Kordia periserrulae]